LLKYASSTNIGGGWTLDSQVSATGEGDNIMLPGQPLSSMALGPITEGVLYGDDPEASPKPNPLGMTGESSGFRALMDGGGAESPPPGETGTALEAGLRELSGQSTASEGAAQAEAEETVLPDSWHEIYRKN
jgi:hypothetical protein